MGRPLFENEPGAQKQGPCPTHRQIVHGSVTPVEPISPPGRIAAACQGIRREGHAGAADLHDCLIVHAVENGVGEERGQRRADSALSRPPLPWPSTIRPLAAAGPDRRANPSEAVVGGIASVLYRWHAFGRK